MVGGMTHIVDRRRFLALSGLAMLGAAGHAQDRLWAPPRRLRLLMLGGTGFVGPHIVSYALSRGHEVTLFNRGVSNPGLFRDLEQLRGDRSEAEALRVLGVDRTWDACIDTWQGSPLAVARAAAALRSRCGHYAYVSSIAVYGGGTFRRPGFDEASPLLDPGPLPEVDDATMDYPRRKRHAERLIAEAFPETSSLHRAHGIVGRDAEGQLAHAEIGLSKAWWPVRIARGGEVLAPGEPSDTTQYTDVVDLAEFIVHAVEEGLTGPFNVCATATMRDFLGELRREARSDARFVWVDHRFLVARGLHSFTDIPQWVSHQEAEPGFYQASPQRAITAGLRTRPVAATYGPIRRAFFMHHAGYDFGNVETGFALARREAEVLAAWKRDRARVERVVPGAEGTAASAHRYGA